MSAPAIVESDTAAPAVDRWRLHRGGVVNVWQYQVEEFDLSGGRAIFQGTNGSGKSRTLELLLPLCLDGDLRNMGSKGFDTVSMRRLMLDDYTGGPNRIGYAWIELRRGNEFLTSGIGVKASANSQAISDSWRFITDRRVGVDLNLISDGAPIGATQLRDELGAECLFDETPFRARIAELVYGIPTVRYGDLLHLQRTLRNPDVGLKVLEGQLEQILSDALPPLDPTMIGTLAGAFEDLHSIRENIHTLEAADSALGTFLTGYRGYALGALRAACQRRDTAADALASARGEIRKLVHTESVQEAQQQEAVERAAAAEHRADTLEGRISGLIQSPQYQQISDLADRKRLVHSAKAAAERALEQATAQRGRADEAADAVTAVVDRLGTDVAGAQQQVDTARERMRAAGLDPRECPAVPDVPHQDLEPAGYRVRASVQPGAEPVAVSRKRAPELDVARLRDTLLAGAEIAGHAESLTVQRRALTGSLVEQAAALDRGRAELDRIQANAKDALVAATTAAGTHNETKQRFEDAAQRWVEQAGNWRAGAPAGQRPPEPPSAADVLADPEVPDAAAHRAADWVNERTELDRLEAAAAQREQEEAHQRLYAVDAELKELRAGVEPEPPRPEFATADRDDRRGAPFYRLVDFGDHLDDEARAGLEAAMQSCGLLTAWVQPDGGIGDPAVRDLLASTAGTALPDGQNLHGLLVAVEVAESAVPVKVITELLSRIGVNDRDDGLVIGANGRWRAGVLSGAMSKKAAQFVGAGARETARRARLAELTEIRTEHADRMAAAQAAFDDARRRVSAWLDYSRRFPTDRPVVEARVRVGHAKTQAERATEESARLREKHAHAADRHQARLGALSADARQAGLEADTEALNRAHRAAGDARGAVQELARAIRERCLRTMDDVVTAQENYHRADAEVGAAEAAARSACAEFDEIHAAYTELEDSLGTDTADLEHELTELESARKQVREQLPGLRESSTAAAVALTKTQTMLATTKDRLGGLVGAESTASAGLRGAIEARGVWAAAMADAPVPDDLDEASGLVAEVSARAATEDTVLTMLQKLQTTLAGSHDVSAVRESGILTVTVTGAEGPLAVADAAAEVSGKLAEQQGFLSEQYQEIFADFMLRDLAEKLSVQIEVAEDLCRRMNATLDEARSSQGVHVQLAWQPSAALDDGLRAALQLIRTPFADRTAEQDAALRQAFTDRIDAERDSQSGGYPEILARALDYRRWYQFTVRVRDAAPDGSPRTRRMRQLSSGETRLISYVTLFAAAAAFYGAVGDSTTQPPLRMVLLDEAFERLDEPTVARMLELLVDLDMDWVITWPSGWGVSDKIPRMHIYDVLRPKSGSGIACTHTTWDGAGLARQG